MRITTIGLNLAIYFFALHSFEIGPSMFYGVQVWAVGRQHNKVGTCSFNYLSDLCTFMPRCIVHDHDLTGHELRAQIITQPFYKDSLIDSAFVGFGSKEFASFRPGSDDIGAPFALAICQPVDGQPLWVIAMGAGEFMTYPTFV